MRSITERFPADSEAAPVPLLICRFAQTPDLAAMLQPSSRLVVTWGIQAGTISPLGWVRRAARMSLLTLSDLRGVS